MGNGGISLLEKHLLVPTHQRLSRKGKNGDTLKKILSKTFLKTNNQPVQQ